MSHSYSIDILISSAYSYELMNNTKLPVEVSLYMKERIKQIQEEHNNRNDRN